MSELPAVNEGTLFKDFEIEVLKGLVDPYYGEAWHAGLGDGSGLGERGEGGGYICAEQFDEARRVVVAGGKDSVSGRRFGVLERKDLAYIAAMNPIVAKQLLRGYAELLEYYRAHQRQLKGEGE